MHSKREPGMATAAVQTGNQSWWTENTMSYDWKDKIGIERFSLEWFDEADKRFIHTSRLFANDKQPFDRIIPFGDLKGAKVLEIGCGMGLHSELMARAGAELHAVDLSPTSVEATRRRFALKGLTGDIQHSDAEKLPFPDGTFDFLWSWGVIHHSSRTARIVREIHRVLKPGGSCRIMVYNRAGMNVAVTWLQQHVMQGKFLKQKFDTTLLASTDGFSARFYTDDQFSDLFGAFFTKVEISVCGQDADAVPLPRHLRKVALKFVSDDTLRKRQSRDGAFLFLTASNPD